MHGWQPPRPPGWKARRTAVIAAGGVFLWVSSYFVFTSWGQYTARNGPGGRVAAIAVLGQPVRYRYRWVPGEFLDYRTGEPSLLLPLIYGPLLALDRALWHTEEKAESGRYPVLREPPLPDRG